MALTDKLSAIADAIREKTGESGTMTLAEMPEKIRTISSKEIIEAPTPARIVAQFDSTFSSNVSGLIPGPADFIKAIYDDYTSLTNSSANLYFFSVKRLDVTLATSGAVGTMDSFFIRSATETAIQVTTESEYNRWFSKNADSTTITLNEARSGGITIGNAIGNTKTINISGAFRTAVSIPAGTYRFIVYRAQLVDDTITAEAEGVGISANSSGIVSAKNSVSYGVKTVTSWEASFTSDVTSKINVPIPEPKFKALLTDYHSISVPDMNMYCYVIRRKNFDLAYGGYIGQAEPFVITSASESSITVNRYSTNSRRITKTANSNSYGYSVAGGIGFVIGNNVVAASVITLDSGAVAAFNASNILPAGNYEISILRICDQATLLESESLSTYQLSSADDEDFISGNIMSGITIFGLQGSGSGGNALRIEGAVPNSEVTITKPDGSVVKTSADATGAGEITVSDAGIYTIFDGVHQTTCRVKNVYNATLVLPSAYQRVEYIEMNSGSLIDTLATGGTKAAYYLKSQPVSNDHQTFFGGTGNDILWRLTSWGGTYRPYAGGQSTYAYWQEMEVTEDNIIRQYKGTGGTQGGTNTIGWGESSWKLRGGSNGNKLMSLKMYTDYVQVRDFVPCYRKSDSEPGLYDLINNVFYTNTGTAGSIAVGADAE